MEENQGKKTIPDLGEGIKPEDVVFSSQNIIGGSVAGSDKKFFGRVKKEVSLKDKINEQLKRNQVANRSRLQKLLQNKKFWIILASILVALALCLALVFILTRKNSHEEGEEVSEIYSGVEEEDDEVAAGIAQYEENISTIANDNLKEVKKSLDDSHYGLDKVKERIIEYLAVKQMTNSLKSPILCLVGPPGVGKTSLAFSIASAVKRNFVKMSVGGVNDEAEIMGHRRTYIGASPGRIIQSLKKAKSNNPVFLIDEIDKMTKDLKGDPASSLLEVLDPEQNKFFSDNYIEEEFDLSKVMFIATANYIEQIPEALKDRLEIVYLSGYTEYEKVDIVKKHLLNKVCEEHGISSKKVEIKDDIILDIIRCYTKEAGVRELEREIATIIRKIVATVVTNNIKFEKVTITKKELIKYLGKEKYSVVKELDNPIGVVNGLAYTNYGGDTLPIEVTFYKGSGKLELTGSLGNVMKESASIALSYIKSNYKQYGIDYNDLIKNDIHIHVPDGAVPKDGPSAGIALTSSLISAFSKLKVSSNIAMTGEITLRGNVLAIGGLKEKSIGAYRNGIKKVIIPKDNIKDLDDVPKEIKKEIDYIPVSNYTEVYDIIKMEG